MSADVFGAPLAGTMVTAANLLCLRSGELLVVGADLSGPCRTGQDGWEFPYLGKTCARPDYRACRPPSPIGTCTHLTLDFTAPFPNPRWSTGCHVGADSRTRGGSLGEDGVVFRIGCGLLDTWAARPTIVVPARVGVAQSFCTRIAAVSLRMTRSASS